MPDTTESPGVGVVIATHNRPELVRRALASVRAQDYPGVIDTALVFDRSEVDLTLARNDPGRRVTVLPNTRTPGLAGARNTGIVHLNTELVAFCDDDDVWLAGKLRAQVATLTSRPDTAFVTTAMRVDYGEQSTVRRAGRDSITVAELARSRMSMLHSSSFLFRRAAMLGPNGFGLVDETMPRSMGEDWDLLLRAARQHPIAHVDEPLVGILWGQTSYFSDAWADKNAAHEWLMTHHREINSDPRARGIMLGKLAFGQAALGQRRKALSTARQAVRANWREPRTPIAALVALGVRPQWVLDRLNRRGHGI
jgi:glycosyltransferase involved in cell wall biosynthesis